MTTSRGRENVGPALLPCPPTQWLLLCSGDHHLNCRSPSDQDLDLGPWDASVHPRQGSEAGAGCQSLEGRHPPAHATHVTAATSPPVKSTSRSNTIRPVVWTKPLLTLLQSTALFTTLQFMFSASNTKCQQELQFQ